VHIRHLYTATRQLRKAGRRIDLKRLSHYSGLRAISSPLCGTPHGADALSIRIDRPRDTAGNDNLTLTSRIALPGILLAGLLSGCSSSVTLQALTIPSPLTEKIPVSVGLRMPANFHNFVHEEQVYGRDVWSIDLGSSHAALFTQLFKHMFRQLTVLEADDDPKLLNIDALIEPSVDGFEFSVPNQSKTDAFAVWIRYRLKVYDSGGTLVSNWPVSSYGKSQTASVSNSEALQRAAILAMRDAAALMIMKLDEVTQISSLADAPAPVAAPTLVPIPETNDEDDVQAVAVEGQDDETG